MYLCVPYFLSKSNPPPLDGQVEIERFDSTPPPFFLHSKEHNINMMSERYNIHTFPTIRMRMNIEIAVEVCWLFCDFFFRERAFRCVCVVTCYSKFSSIFCPMVLHLEQQSQVSLSYTRIIICPYLQSVSSAHQCSVCATQPQIPGSDQYLRLILSILEVISQLRVRMIL